MRYFPSSVFYQQVFCPEQTVTMPPNGCSNQVLSPGGTSSTSPTSTNNNHISAKLLDTAIELSSDTIIGSNGAQVKVDLCLNTYKSCSAKTVDHAAKDKGSDNMGSKSHNVFSGAVVNGDVEHRVNKGSNGFVLPRLPPIDLFSNTPETSRPCTPQSCASSGTSQSNCLLSEASSANITPSSSTPKLTHLNGFKLFSDSLKQGLERTDSQCSHSSQSSDSQSQKPEETVECRWTDCGAQVESQSLTDHIKLHHVDTQVTKETVVCLWKGCKVYNKPSSNKTWLGRHVLTHSGDKPFKCIVEGCGVRFPSQFTLERHVQAHFNTYQPTHGRPGRPSHDTPSKQKKRNKLKRKRIHPIKTTDYFDAQIMEKLHQQLIGLNEKLQMDTNTASNYVTFRSTVIAQRTDQDGVKNLLIQWTPHDVLNDEWVRECDYSSTRQVALPDLPHTTGTNLHSAFYSQLRHRKHRRK